MTNLTKENIKSLLCLQSKILDELNNRGVLRTGNNPAGDVAEYLFCKTFNWKLEPNSKSGFDATDENGNKFQIKSRKLKTNAAGERLLSDFRDLEHKKFDFLAAVIFNHNFSIYKAAILPHSTIVDKVSSYSKHTNAHKFYLRDNIWSLESTRDVTQKLRETFNGNIEN